jgi:hypothetical protein
MRSALINATCSLLAGFAAWFLLRFKTGMKLEDGSREKSSPAVGSRRARNAEHSSSTRSSEPYEGFELGSHSNPEPLQTPPTSRPVPSGYVEGEARFVQRGAYSRTNQWGQTAGTTVHDQSLSFRLIVRNSAREQFQEHDVLMRGPLIVGSLQDGERVAIRRSSLRAKAISEPDRIVNLSTGADITVKNTTGASYGTLVGIFILLGLVILLIVMTNSPKR